MAGALAGRKSGPIGGTIAGSRRCPSAMPSYRADPSRPDRAKAIGGVLAVYAALGAALLLARSDSPLDREQNPPTVLIDVIEPPEPQPPPEEQAGRAEEEEGAAGKKAEPTPVVAPKP